MYISCHWQRLRMRWVAMQLANVIFFQADRHFSKTINAQKTASEMLQIRGRAGGKKTRFIQKHPACVHYLAIFGSTTVARAKKRHRNYPTKKSTTEKCKEIMLMKCVKHEAVHSVSFLPREKIRLEYRVTSSWRNVASVSTWKKQ